MTRAPVVPLLALALSVSTCSSHHARPAAAPPSTRSVAPQRSALPFVPSESEGAAYLSRSARTIVFSARSRADGRVHVFVRDVPSGRFALADLSDGGVAGNASGYARGVSGDGEHVLFLSLATNLVAGTPGGGAMHLFERDLARRRTVLVSLSPAGKVLRSSPGSAASLSADGRYVAFDAGRDGRMPHLQVLVRDTVRAVTLMASARPDGAAADADSSFASVSPDGRWVAFTSAADNLVAGDTNGVRDVFARELLSGRLVRISVGPHGHQGVGDAVSGAFSTDGRYVSFVSSEHLTADACTAGRGSAPEPSTYLWDVEREELSHPPETCGSAGDTELAGPSSDNAQVVAVARAHGDYGDFFASVLIDKREVDLGFRSQATTISSDGRFVGMSHLSDDRADGRPQAIVWDTRRREAVAAWLVATA